MCFQQRFIVRNGIKSADGVMHLEQIKKRHPIVKQNYQKTATPHSPVFLRRVAALEEYGDYPRKQAS